MKLGNLTKRKEKAGLRTHLPSNVVGAIFGGILLLVILATIGAPQLYKFYTEPSFQDAFFVDQNRDRILNYSAHEALDTITTNNGSFEIVTSQASRRVDEIIVIYNDGVRATLVIGLISSLVCGVAIAFFIIRGHTKKTAGSTTRLVVAIIVLALGFLNWTTVIHRSNNDIQEYNVAQPLVAGSLAILAFSSIEQNAFELFDAAVERGAQRDAVDKQKSGFVHYAARADRNAMLKKLAIFPDVQFDQPNLEGQTPVQIAVAAGHMASVQTLIDQGADPQNPDDDGRTLLHVAAANDDVEMLKLLLLHTKGLNMFDDNGETPLALVARNLDFDIVSLMLDNGADVNALMNDSTTFFEVILAEVLELVKSRAALTPDQQTNLVTLIERMVEMGADLARKNSDGNTPLHRVCLLYEDLISQGLVEVSMLSKLSRSFIQSGAETGERNAQKINALPLSLVIRLGRDEWLDRAIHDNADRLNTYKIDGVSLFQYAVEHGKADILTKLFAKGMTTKPWVPASDDPLRPLILRNDIDTAEILLQQNYITSERLLVEQDGPLHLAAKNDLDEMTELLIDNGFDVNAQGNRGNTALHYAIEAKALRSMLVLVEKQADPLIWNQEGITPQMKAESLRIREISELIKRAIKDRDPRRPAPEPPADVEAAPEGEETE